MSQQDVLTARPVAGAVHADHGACPGCGSSRLDRFYEVRGVPVNSCLLFDDREEAIGCPKGDIALAYCQDCDFVFNAAFDATQLEYSGRYEETQGFSPTFSRFHRQLAADMIERHDLHGRQIMEIGCGKGEFLVLLSQLGANRGIGVDPSALPERLLGIDGAERITLVPEYFQPSHCETEPDFLCCKMTLEHIPDTGQFVDTIRAGLSDDAGTVVFFQVPEAERIFEQCAFEDIYHEHCSYFTQGSLARLFEARGFRITRSAREYDGQYLTVEAAVTASEPENRQEATGNLASLVASFPERVAAAQDHWRSLVRNAAAGGKKIVLWGSGSKAVSFLTTLGVGDSIACVTDINPNRHGYFMPGTGHRIVPPAELAAVRPDLVIVMNRIYEGEIAASLNDLGVACELHCL